MLTFFKFIILSVVFGSLGAMIVISIIGTIQMIRNPDLHFFPSVTRCRICGKRVFVWQRQESRKMDINVDNPRNVAIQCSGRAIVHMKCKGVPTGRISIRSVR